MRSTMSSSSSDSTGASSSEGSRPPSPEPYLPRSKKPRVTFLPGRSDAQPVDQRISRHTLRRWEAEGILVPEDSSDDSNQPVCEIPNADVDPLHQNVFSESEDESDSSQLTNASASETASESENKATDSSDEQGGESDPGDDSDSDSHETQDLANRLLFEGSKLNTEEAVLMILNLYLKNRWSKKSLHGVLEMVVALLPKPNSLPKSLFLLFKFVENVAPVNTPESIYFYCGRCQYFIGTESNPCDVCSAEGPHQFYAFSVKDQVKFLFENRHLAELLDKHNVNNEMKEGVISDICSGSEYKRVKVSDQYSITLLWNTDGVSKFGGSSEGQFWPLQYVICELPYFLRKQFMIVCAIWFDEKKPTMNTFLRPFVECLREIHEEGGVSWTHPTTSEVHRTSVCAPGFCGDAPARADVQVVEQHMSKRGCNVCEQEREQISQREAEEAGMAVRRSYFNYQEHPAQLRTDKRMNSQGLKAASNKSEGKRGYSVKGVKGPSLVSLIPLLDRSAFVYPEYMHCVCVGVVLQFINLWFFSPKSKSFWGEGINFTELVDKFLTGIKPTDHTRIPREISKVPRKKWRAHEYWAWLLFFSLPSVYQFMKGEYVQHWILLVIALYLLLKEEISADDLAKAESLLKEFVKEVKKLYGTCTYTYNVHQLLHLPLAVKRWGPLWANSTFMFENSNGILSRLIHGPNKKAKELIKNLKICQAICILRNRQNDSKVSSKDACELSKEVKLKVGEQDYLIDAAKDICRPRFFSRAVVGNVTFTSKVYDLEKMRNNFTVCFQSADGKRYGEIECFVLDDQSKELFSVVNAFKVVHTKLFFHASSRTKVSHIIPIQDADTLSLVRVDCIKEKVLRVGDFVCHVPNNFEKKL